MWVTAAMLVQVLLELDGFHTGSGSAARSHGSINTITLLDVNTITLLDVGLSRPHPDPPTWLAVKVCVGLANRDGSGHPPVSAVDDDVQSALPPPPKPDRRTLVNWWSDHLVGNAMCIGGDPSCAFVRGAAGHRVDRGKAP